jgi:hypothetical protein
MDSFDLCLAWNWEYDADFVALLTGVCQGRSLSLLQITPSDLAGRIEDIHHQQLRFAAYYDRASDTEPGFRPLGEWASRNDVFRINPLELARRCWDKSVMHDAITGACRHTPTTIVLPSHDLEPELSCLDLSPLGSPFIVKPAHGGGGDGVVTAATCLDHVLEARRQFPADKYLLQAHIAPTLLEGRLAWFRVLYCTGKVYPCWWDTSTHLYVPVSPEEEHRLGLQALRNITATTAHFSGLSVFSTEIALTAEGRFVTVDYVNDPVDLRIQSKAKDGVPDSIVHDIAARLADLVASRLPK